jgi:hypothetical protein
MLKHRLRQKKFYNVDTRPKKTEKDKKYFLILFTINDKHSSLLQYRVKFCCKKCFILPDPGIIASSLKYTCGLYYKYFMIVIYASSPG